MTGICQFDYDRFTAALEALGFHREPYYDPLAPWPSHRLMYDSFEHPDKRMRIEVSPRGEASEPLEKITHNCVETIFIN